MGNWGYVFVILIATIMGKLLCKKELVKLYLTALFQSWQVPPCPAGLRPLSRVIWERRIDPASAHSVYSLQGASASRWFLNFLYLQDYLYTRSPPAVIHSVYMICICYMIRMQTVFFQICPLRKHLPVSSLYLVYIQQSVLYSPLQLLAPHLSLPSSMYSSSSHAYSP